jgi:hypothetical protein
MNENDPLLARMIAGIRYGVKRYGGMADGLRGAPYDQGGMLTVGGTGINLLSKPEPVLTPEQVAQLGKRPPE